ncbi:GGDEF domain-containing protein [Sanguibacter suaedae]|uniref:GGDEF domain-containing protein n=1 Tax=Sanguibacter suaedae TaxID=2795737 RepID=A0A934MC65_9MICO|nr:GGDEF domain-containing protein [Sanguibacter suaedae]MBI9113579.1 GGDEF domain-containing protein [Sanguibacter suaedae]
MNSSRPAQHVDQPVARRAPVVADVAHPVEVVDSTLSCRALEEIFRSDSVECIGVRDVADAHRVGLVTRDRCFAAMSGELGYGRALLYRKPVSELTDWSPTFVDPWWSVSDALRVAMARPRRRRYDDLVVRSQVWGAVNVASLIHSLSGELVARTDHDALTGIRDRHAWLGALDVHTRAASEQDDFVAVFVATVDGVAAVNGSHGFLAGDTVLAAVARRLREEFVPRSAVGRLGGTQFGVFAPVAAVSLDDALEQVRGVADRLGGAGQSAVRALVHEGVLRPGETPVSVRLGYALAPHGASGEALVTRAVERLEPVLS